MTSAMRVPSGSSTARACRPPWPSGWYCERDAKSAMCVVIMASTSEARAAGTDGTGLCERAYWRPMAAAVSGTKSKTVSSSSSEIVKTTLCGGS